MYRKRVFLLIPRLVLFSLRRKSFKIFKHYAYRTSYNFGLGVMVFFCINYREKFRTSVPLTYSPILMAKKQTIPWDITHYQFSALNGHSSVVFNFIQNLSVFYPYKSFYKNHRWI